MKLSLATVSLGIAAASAAKNGRPKQRQLEGEADADMSWMSGYTLKYENCFYTDSTVSFQLCPEGDSCSSGCDGGAEYLVDLNFFLDAFTEAQMGAREYICEVVRENCEYDDEDVCYKNAGIKYCGDGDEFNIQEYLECTEWEDGYYVGPYCADDSHSIYLGFFTDQYCTSHAEDGTFYNMNGYELPYSSDSIIDDDCGWCREHGLQEHQGYGDQDDEDDVLEQCEDLYYEATKCELDIDVENPDTSGCNYIEELRSVEDVEMSSSRGGSGSRTSSVLWGLIVALLVVGAMVGCWIFMKRRRSTDSTELAPAKEQLI